MRRCREVVKLLVRRRLMLSMLLTLALLCAHAGAAPAAEVAPAPGGMPAFEPAPCWSPRAAAASVRCGYVSVPESRERPNGRSIRIAVAILAPAGAPPDILRSLGEGKLSPLVYLNGGPGYATGLDGATFDYWIDWYRGWRGGRDRALILVDQRGTGRSQPRLSCDSAVRRASLLGTYAGPSPRDPEEGAAHWAAYLQACRAPFDAAGIDVTAYNGAENAADLVALRRALGIARWDVWGTSYGTELALELLRIDEAAIRSLILDSVSLYQHPDVVPGNVAAAFDRALTAVIRDCLLNDACRDAFPGLQTGLSHKMAWLNRIPQQLPLPPDHGWDDAQFVLDGRRVAELLFTGMYSPDLVPGLPATLFWLAGDRIEPMGFLAAGMLSAYADDAQSELVMISTDCRTMPHGETLARLRDQERRYPRYVALWTVPYLEAVCAGWGSTPARPAELAPVHSDVPALILGGRYDPITPPEWGRIVAEWLPNSRFVEFPHLTHGSVGFDPCADAIAADFLEDPAADPMAGCFAELSVPAFLVP